VTDQPHRSRNLLHYRVDPRLDELRKKPEWVAFHKACGQHGLFFDDIDPVGRSGQYGAVTFRLERSAGGYYDRFLVSEGRGAGPIDAVIAAYRAAVAKGFSVDPGLDALLTGTPAPTIEEDDIMALIG